MFMICFLVDFSYFPWYILCRKWLNEVVTLSKALWSKRVASSLEKIYGTISTREDLQDTI